MVQTVKDLVDLLKVSFNSKIVRCETDIYQDSDLITKIETYEMYIIYLIIQSF